MFVFLIKKNPAAVLRFDVIHNGIPKCHSYQSSEYLLLSCFCILCILIFCFYKTNKHMIMYSLKKHLYLKR